MPSLLAARYIGRTKTRDKVRLKNFTGTACERCHFTANTVSFCVVQATSPVRTAVEAEERSPAFMAHREHTRDSRSPADQGCLLLPEWRSSKHASLITRAALARALISEHNPRPMHFAALGPRPRCNAVNCHDRIVRQMQLGDRQVFAQVRER